MAFQFKRMTQNNLGAARGRLGKRQSGSETLSKAVDAFHEALTVFDKEQSPYNWQKAQGNLDEALALCRAEGAGRGFPGQVTLC
jgi:hypothetical protein